MLAHALRWGLLVEMALYCFVATVWSVHENLGPGSAVLIVVALVLGTRAAIVGLMFFSAWQHRSKPPPDLRIGPLAMARLVLSEYAALCALYTLLQPFEIGPGKATNPARQDDNGSGLPVLLIHGFFCNHAVWSAVAKDLRHRGIDSLYTIDLEPVLGSINDYAEQVSRRVEQICSQTGARQVILVGHSMGGLVARAYVHWLSGWRRVAKVITLGSPHHGSELTKLLLLKGPNTRQMDRGSRWLARLNEAEEDPMSVPTTSIYSYHDDMVAPQESSVLDHPHVKNIPVAGIGHLAMVFSRPIQALLYQEIAAATAVKGADK